MSILEAFIPGIASQVESFRSSDKAREELLLDIITKLEAVLKDNTDLNRDLNSEKLTRRHYQDQIDRLNSQIRFVENNTSFVLALIDGDGVIFHDMFLKAAAEGGSAAASKLQSAIQEYIATLYENTTNWSISVNIYVSLDKLGQRLAQAGYLKGPQEFRAFVQGFNVNQPLFNFVDVGYGKERADNKLRETLRAFIDNPTCKHIIFGGCHDAGYLNNLEPYKHDANKASRITLLESTPYYPGFVNLPSSFKRARFDDVFKPEPLPEFGPPLQPPNRVMSSEKSAGVAKPTSNKPISPTKPLKSEPTSAIRSPSNSSLISGGSELTQGSWATVGKNDDNKTNKISIVSKMNSKKKKYAYYNKDGYRLDEPLPAYDKAAGESIRQRMLKGGRNLCNNFHLNKGECKNQWCQFQHEPKLSEAELNALRWKARTLACKDRYCENVDCYLGHQCLNERDRGYCSFEGDCHFKHTHGMDQIKHQQWDEDGKVFYYK